MEVKKTFSIYMSHGGGFDEEDLVELAQALMDNGFDKELTIKQDSTPDGLELLFIVEH